MGNFAEYMQVCELYESILDTFITHKIDCRAFAHYLTESNSEMAGSAIGGGVGAAVGSLGGPFGTMIGGAAGSLAGSMGTRYLKRKAHEGHPPELTPQIQQTAQMVDYLIQATADLHNRTVDARAKLGGGAPIDPRERATYSSIAPHEADLGSLKNTLTAFRTALNDWINTKGKRVDADFEAGLHHEIMAGKKQPQSGFMKWARSWT